jgi:HEAT repeat protein
MGLGLLAKNGKAGVPGLIQALSHPRREMRFLAARELGKLGPDARDASEALIGAMKQEKDAHGRVVLASNLARVAPDNPAVISAFTNHALDPNNKLDVRILALDHLGQLKQKAKDAVPALEKLTKDKEEVIRKQAVWALTQIEGR